MDESPERVLLRKIMVMGGDLEHYDHGWWLAVEGGSWITDEEAKLIESLTEEVPSGPAT
jgi:hypothetical protein